MLNVVVQRFFCFIFPFFNNFFFSFFSLVFFLFCFVSISVVFAYMYTLYVEILPKKRKRCSSEKRKSYVPSIKKTIHSTNISHVAKSPKYQRPQLLRKNRYAQRPVKNQPNWRNTVVCPTHQHRQITQATNSTLMNQCHRFLIKVHKITFASHSFRCLDTSFSEYKIHNKVIAVRSTALPQIVKHLHAFEMDIFLTSLAFILPFFLFAASLQPNFSYVLPDNMPFEYHCNAYANNNSTSHNHNSAIHVNNSVSTGIGKLSFSYIISWILKKKTSNFLKIFILFKI